MQKPSKTFGSYIKEKRIAQTPRITLKQMAELLSLNLTYLSDVENGRKNPFNAEKIELFCEVLNLTSEEKEIMYDLAARDNGSVPEDIADAIMYTEEGDYARRALRMANQGKGNVDLWKDLIRKMEEDS